MKKICEKAHFEKCRSEDRSLMYCQKEKTRAGSFFELGERPIRRNSKTDWDEIYDLAKAGKFEEIPKEILIKHYNSL